MRRHDSGADPLLDDGKRHNIALAAPYFDGVELSPDRPFSFWRNLGRITRSRGFRHGMELRGGCIVPALGGGICLLSNALFRMACELGWTIHERHGHTMEAAPPLDFAPSVCRGVAAADHDQAAAPWGMDATVFWPHVDLRFAPRSGRVRLGVTVIGDVLRLCVHGDAPMPDISVILESTADVIEGVVEGVIERGTETAIDQTIEGQPDASPVRRNRVVRRIICGTTGRALACDTVAENRKRLLDPAGQRRNCLTCDQTQCHARPRETDQLIQLRTRLARPSGLPEADGSPDGSGVGVH